jgi:hypothetical protein
MKKFILLLPVLFMLLVQTQTLKAGDTTSVTVTDSVGKPVYKVIDSIFWPLDRSAMNGVKMVKWQNRKTHKIKCKT